MNDMLVNGGVYSIAGVEDIARFGTAFIVAALMVHTVAQMYKQIAFRSSEMLDPLFKAIVGVVAVNNLDFIGDTMHKFSRGICLLLGSGDEFNVIRDVVSDAFSNTPELGLGSAIASFGFRGLATLALILTISFMQLVKILIIDVVYPLLFVMVLVSGAVVIPLSSLPGPSIKSWFALLLEISLWPIAYSIMVVAMVSMFRSEITNITAAFSALNAPELQNVGDQNPLYDLYKFICFCIVLSFGTLKIPLLCSMLVRGYSAAFVGQGIVGSMFSSEKMMAQKATQAISSAIKSGFSGMQTMKNGFRK